MSTVKKVLMGLLLAVVILATVAGISFAAEKGSVSKGASAFVYGCRGFFGGAINDVANLLGMKPEQIIEKRNAGKSLADIASDKGFTEKEVVSEILKSREQILDERVKAGIITEEQKKLMLDRMKSGIEQGITDPTVGSGRGGGGFGPGRGGPGFGGRGGCCGGGPGGAWGQKGTGFRGGPGAGGGVRNTPSSATSLPTGNF